MPGAKIRGRRTHTHTQPWPVCLLNLTHTLNSTYQYIIVIKTTLYNIYNIILDSQTPPFPLSSWQSEVETADWNKTIIFT